MQIRIYGQPDCVWCNRAKALCETRNFDHSYIDISEDAAARDYVLARVPAQNPPSFTVPQIFVGERRIGGFTQLALADNDGSLQQLIGGE